MSTNVTAFTAAMRTEYLKALHGLEGVPPAPWEAFTTRIPSTARIETYSWMSAVPGMKEYTGKRDYANIDSISYSVENKEYDASFKVKLRDLKDDQIGGYMMLPGQMVKKAQQYPGYLLLRHLRKGKYKTCFDGTAFFADSHTIGSGDNLMAKDCASNDGVIHNIIVMNKTGAVKPLVFQDRQPLSEESLQSNEGKDDRESKELRFWCDMEMAAAYGFWWDALCYEITDTPTVTELQTILGEIEDRFRTFQLPKALATDEAEYPHEGWNPSPDTTTILCSTTIANAMRTVLESETIVQSGAPVTNIYRGWGQLVPSAILNGALPTSD